MFSNLLSYICESSNHTQHIIDVGKLQGEERSFTIKELADTTRNFMNYFSEKMIKAGDDVVLIANNSFETIAIFCAIIDIGACANIIPIKNSVNDICELIDKIHPKYICCSSTYLHHKILSSKYCDKQLTYCAEKKREVYISDNSRHDTDSKVEADMPVSILFSSGTTNKPKGIVLPFKAYTNNSQQIGRHIKLSQEDKYLAVLPFSYIAGQITSIIAPLHFGSDLVVCDSQNIGSILRVIEKYSITKTNLVPTLLYRALKLNLPDTYNVSSLKFVLSGGSECGIKLIEEIRSKYGIRIVEGYGSTETGCGNCINDIDSPITGSVGKPLPGHQIRLIANNDNDTCVAIHSDTMMLRYFNGDSPVKDGWFITSDIGHMDEQGNLFIEGRKDDIIKCMGERVYLNDIKKILMHHAEVHNVVVIGIDDEECSKKPVAFIQLNKNINEFDQEEFFEWINRNFNRVSKPDIIFINEFPTTHSEKIDIQALKNRYIGEKGGGCKDA